MPDWVFELLGFNPDPDEHLKQLSRLLMATNTRLVFAVEDLDRNEGHAFDAQAILAMLHRCKSVDGLSFILAGRPNAGGARIDYEKLCDHIEAIPTLHEPAFWEVVVQIRKECLERYSDIDPSSEKRDLFANEMIEAFGLPSRRSAFLSMLVTPRAFKHAIRHTVDAWERLHGEIDFDSLIIANVLRYGAPQAFEFILKYSNALREQTRTRTTPGEDEAEKQKIAELTKAWEATIQGVSWDVTAAMSLIAEIMPGAWTIFDPNVPRDLPGLQSVACLNPTDYWARLLDEGLGEDDVHDQAVLRAIGHHYDESKSKLAQEMYESKRFSHIWEYFSDRFPNDRLLDLAGQVSRIALAADGADADAECPALTSIWRITCRRDGQRAESLDWVKEILRLSLPTSIGFWNDFYHLWVRGPYRVVQSQDVPEVRNAVLNTAKLHFKVDDPSILLNAIGTRHSYAISHLIIPPGETEEREESLALIHEWRWLAPVILAGANANPSKMITQIGWLVGIHDLNHFNTSKYPYTHKIDDRVINGMFAEHRHEVLTL